MSSLGASVMEAENCVIAVDLGGTTVKGIALDARGTVLALETRPTVLGRVLESVIDVLLSLRSSVEASGVEVVGVGVIAPGIVDEERGRIAYAANLGWREVALREQLERRLGLPVAVGQDVRAAGVAEHRLGAARGLQDFILVPVGTGVAAALVTGGTAVRGIGGAGGEFGHMPVVRAGELCPCGQRGCLENYVSGAAISRRYLARTGQMLTTEDVVARRVEDPVAAEVWDDAVDVFAHGLASLTMLFDPALVVVGGGLSELGEVLLDPLRARLAELLAWRAAPVLARSALGAHAGRYGAALLALDVAGVAADTDNWMLDPDLTPQASARIGALAQMP